jgi:hypothetical protein
MKSAQPDQQDPRGDGEYPHGGARRNALLQCNNAENEYHDRGGAASDRIHNAELTTPIRPGKQHEIEELERRGCGDEGDGFG